MDGDGTVKKLLEGKPGGGNKRTRPKSRRVENVNLNLRNRGVKRWRTRALDRTEWASVIREAKAKLKRL
jgi:hypothetical protein